MGKKKGKNKNSNAAEGNEKNPEPSTSQADSTPSSSRGSSIAQQPSALQQDNAPSQRAQGSDVKQRQDTPQQDAPAQVKSMGKKKGKKNKNSNAAEGNEKNPEPSTSQADSTPSSSKGSRTAQQPCAPQQDNAPSQRAQGSDVKQRQDTPQQDAPAQVKSMGKKKGKKNKKSNAAEGNEKNPEPSASQADSTPSSSRGSSIAQQPCVPQQDNAPAQRAPQGSNVKQWPSPPQRDNAPAQRAPQGSNAWQWQSKPQQDNVPAQRAPQGGDVKQWPSPPQRDNAPAQRAPQGSNAWLRQSKPQQDNVPAQRAPQEGDVKQWPSPPQRDNAPAQRAQGSDIKHPSGPGGDNAGQSPRDKKGKKSICYDKAMERPVRIIKGLSGRKIKVTTNHYSLNLPNKAIIVYHYDVNFKPERPKTLCKTAFEEFVKIYFPKRIVVFDGVCNALCKGPLIEKNSFTGNVTVVNPDNNKEKDFNIMIQEVRRVPLKQPNKNEILDEATISILNIIMNHYPSLSLIKSGSSFFFSQKDYKGTSPVSLRNGFFSSVVFGSRPFLNFDLSFKFFYNKMSMVDVAEGFYRDEELSAFIKNLKVVFKQSADLNVVYKVNGLVSKPTEQTFRDSEGNEITVADYFLKEKKYKIRREDLPLLWVGSTKRTIYIPMELCSISPNQLYKGPPDTYSSELRKGTMDARTRRRETQNTYSVQDFKNPFVREFGISVDDKMTEVFARVYNPPNLTTGNKIVVSNGVWQAREFLEPKSIGKWCILNASDGRSRLTRSEVDDFQNNLKRYGMQLKILRGGPEISPMEVRPNLKELKKAFTDLKDMDLVFVIITDQKELYGQVKKICEIEQSILTQCVKQSTIARTFKSNPETFIRNIFKKVNAKLGGKNVALSEECVPEILKGKVMIIGADVTHPSPGSSSPSLAAVTACHDPQGFRYECEILLQEKEMIKEFYGITKNFLKRFYELRRCYPEKVIYYRDGVSDGQFADVCDVELKQIKDACREVCNAKITVIVVQKRHHTKFYPTCPKDEVGKNFNVPVGTCVDSEIVRHDLSDFYLLSHQSGLGTARPTKYRLLYDDNHIDINQLIELTFYLCHIYSKCDRSISYPIPTRYAHLAAFHYRSIIAQLNMNTEKDEDQDKDKPKVHTKITATISKKYPMCYI